MDGWMDGWMDGCMNGWMDGWMDGWMVAVIKLLFMFLVILNFSIISITKHIKGHQGTKLTVAAKNQDCL